MPGLVEIWCIFAILLLSTLEKGRDPLFEQTWIPFIQGYFVPSWSNIIHLALGFWRRRFLNFVNVFSLLSPLRKGCGCQSWIPFTQGWFVPSLVELSQWFLRRKWKMLKVYNNYDDNDKHQGTNSDKKKLTWAFDLGELMFDLLYLYKYWNFKFINPSLTLSLSGNVTS